MPALSVYISKLNPRKHLEAGHYLSASETPLEWDFGGGPIVAPTLTDDWDG